MFITNKNSENSIFFSLSSDLCLVDDVIKECERYFDQFGISDSFEFKLVLRELINNAIEHGNRKITDRIVTCSIECIRKRLFKIVVRDEGNGFDYDTLDMTFPDPLEDRNRGFALIKAFSKRVEFNKAGNCVTAYVYADNK